MDTSIYLDINRFAAETSWAHGFIRVYADLLGVILLAALVVLAFLRARSDHLGTDNTPRIAGTLITAAGAALALLIGQPISRAVARPRPYVALHHVEVLVPRTGDFSLPSDHATIAGAIIVGLWLCRDRLVASIATVLGLFLAFARVYVGAHYPGDVLAGLGLGAVVVAACYLLALHPVSTLVRELRKTPLGLLVGAARHHHPPATDGGPAAHPAAASQSGSVRLLSEQPVRPQHADDGNPQRPYPAFGGLGGHDDVRVKPTAESS